MIFIKYILIFFVFLAFTYIGNTYAKKYVSRVKELEKMQNLLNIFKSKIKFTGLTIQEIFNQIYDDNKDVVGDIFKRASLNMENMSAKDGWKKAIEESQDKLSLNKEDFTAIGTLGKMLGNTDVEGQVGQIELTEKLIEDQIENAKIEKQKNTKLYKTLGVTVGLTAVILLLWKGIRLKNNYNFGYVKYRFKRGYIHHVCALTFEIHFSCQNLILFQPNLCK